jgi:hypothetical protein
MGTELKLRSAWRGDDGDPSRVTEYSMSMIRAGRLSGDKPVTRTPVAVVALPAERNRLWTRW